MLYILTNLYLIKCYHIPTQEINTLQETGHTRSSGNSRFRSPTEEIETQYKERPLLKSLGILYEIQYCII